MIVTRTELGFMRRLAMKGTIRVLAVWTLGLAVLLGSTGVGLAFKPNATYCQCSCRNATGTADLRWEKVAHCNLDGRRCSFNNPYANFKLQPGKLDSCMTCQSDSKGSLLCSASDSSAAPAPGPLLRTPLESSKTITPRGLEGQPSVEGIENPVEQEPAEEPSGK